MLDHYRRKTIFFIATLATVLIGSVVAILFAQGYRPNLNQKKLEKTGMISFTSYPTGAQFFINGKLKGVSNNSVSGLKPKDYLVEIKKEGFNDWQKKIDVFAEMVTDITALLISKTPRLDPITSNGAELTSVSNSGNELIYASYGEKKAGLWLITLYSGAPLNLFKSKARLVIADDPLTAYSQAKEVSWAPDDSEILVKISESGYLLVPVDGKSEPLKIFDPELVFDSWQTDMKKKRQVFLEKTLIDKSLKTVALDPKTLWSPNERRFLYKIENQSFDEYHIYDLSQPLAVGTKKDNFVLKLEKDQPLKVFWHAGGSHLILVEGEVEKDKQGSISLIEYDGGNQTEVYSGTLFSDQVYSTPDGGSLLVLTSFNPKREPNIYAIGIR